MLSKLQVIQRQTFTNTLDKRNLNEMFMHIQTMSTCNCEECVSRRGDKKKKMDLNNILGLGRERESNAYMQHCNLNVDIKYLYMSKIACTQYRLIST